MIWTPEAVIDRCALVVIVSPALIAITALAGAVAIFDRSAVAFAGLEPEPSPVAVAAMNRVGTSSATQYPPLHSSPVRQSHAVVHAYFPPVICVGRSVHRPL